MNYDNEVLKWYSAPGHINVTSPGEKLLDRALFEATQSLLRRELTKTLVLGPSVEDSRMAWVSLDRSETVMGMIEGRRVLGDVRWLPFASSVFEAVFDFSTGDHVYAMRDRMRRDVYRVLEPGGAYVITYPNQDFLGRPEVFEAFGYARFWFPHEIEEELVNAGFSVTLRKAVEIRSEVVGIKPCAT